MAFIGNILIFLLEIYTFIIIIQVVMSWLIAFGVINTQSPQARRLIMALDKLTDPVMQPVRRYVPSIGGIDVSPIIVIFAIMLVKNLVARIFFGF